MSTESHNTTDDLGLLTLRLIVGGLLAGHGAQKLFGSFDGPGMEGTTGMMKSLGMEPKETWAMLAGASEFGSGLLIALGLLGPIGPLSAYGPMVIAWATAHSGKPIWNTKGGAELPLINLGAATALACTGPGRFSLDQALGVRIPKPLAALTALGVAGGIAAALLGRE